MSLNETAAIAGNKTGAISAHVLVVDDDPTIREAIAAYLEDNQIRVTALASGRDIAEVMMRETIHLVVLDVRLPGEDGMQIARRLRQKSLLPIIMLSGLRDVVDRVMGLELGADDYLTKPFSPRELLARIRALLRRARAQEGLQTMRAYCFEGFELNVDIRRLAGPDGKNIAITNSEFNLLAAFLAAPQRVLSRDQLLTLSRPHPARVYERTIDVQLGRLRRKIPALARADPHRTRRGLRIHRAGRGRPLSPAFGA
jgi:DNA-binding response OmpR family regulator